MVNCNNPFNRSRLGAAIAAALFVSALPLSAALAQDEASMLDRIEVTGSRIKKAEVEGQAPVQTITREDIQRSGLTSVGDIIQNITASGSSLNTKFNSSGNFGFPPDGGGVGAGATTVDLRHLGAKRVLVLVDGIRWVNEASASGVSAATDLNTIPVNIVDRIEVLEDGASSIYGSDAIAGVVNIITRRDYDGASATVYYGENEEGDGETTQYDISFGGSGDRFSYFLGASYVNQEQIASKDRDIASFPVPGTGLTFASSATPNGRFRFFDPSCPSVDLDEDPTTPNVNYCNITTPNGQSFPNGVNYPEDFIPFTTANRFNFAQYNLMLTPSERRGLFGQTRYQLTDNTTWYFRALYNNRQSTNQAAPEPIFLGPGGGTGNPYADDIFISHDNPYNPFGFDLISSGPDANLILAARRPVEGGPRRFLQDVDTWYVATGLEGAFDMGDRSFFWDLNYVKSENKAEQTNYGSYNIKHINEALGPLAICQADPRCVPLNIFGGPGTLTPEMLAYIQPIIHDSSRNGLQLLSANLSGDLFDLPAGPLAFATGYEHRRLNGAYMPDALTIAGEYNGVPSLPTAGKYDVDEYYVELNAPLYDAGDSKLDLSLAGRYSDYSTFGGETTGKLGLRWQINDEFLVRGTYAEGFRAPSIGELYSSFSRFDATLDDPCSIGLDGSPPEGSAQNCAALGVPAGYSQANSQISVVTGGNRALDPEQSNSYTLGMVWSPAFAVDAAWSQKLDFEFTYYNHELDHAIQAPDAQTQLDLCVAMLAPEFCNGISRASTGDISRFNNQLVNIGKIDTDGYDFNVGWTLPESDWGQFKVNWENTWVNDYEAVDIYGVRQPREVGVEVNDSGIPEWMTNVRVGWTYGDWNASWTVRYLSSLEEDCGDAADFDICSNPANGTNKLDATAYNDVQVGWHFDWMGGVQLSAGINNVFGEDPPPCLSCSLNGMDASLYDVPGRFWYARAEVKF